MSEWSKKRPNRPGWYWHRSPAGPEGPLYVGGRAKFSGEFGPAIPSAEALEKAKEALREAAARLSAEGYPKDAHDCRAALAALENE